jgi:phosphoglycolate phosphatase
MTEKEPTTAIKNVIFDFDGVIADSFIIFQETLQEILKRPTKFTDEEAEELRSLKTLDVMKKLGVKKWQLPSGLIKGRRGLTEKVDRVSIFPGMPEVLNKLKDDKLKLYVLTSSSDQYIGSSLNRYELLDIMTHVYSSAGLFDKAKRLKKIIKAEGLLLPECVYVGDETRDIDAAKQIGMKCIAVGWGYNNVSALKSSQPNMIVNHPKDLLGAIQKI